MPSHDGHTCNPHSVLSLPAQRPARLSSPGATGSGARPAADARVAALAERVLRQFVERFVQCHVVVGERGERVHLHQPATDVVRGDWCVGPGGAVGAAHAGDPGLLAGDAPGRAAAPCVRRSRRRCRSATGCRAPRRRRGARRGGSGRDGCAARSANQCVSANRYCVSSRTISMPGTAVAATCTRTASSKLAVTTRPSTPYCSAAQRTMSPGWACSSSAGMEGSVFTASFLPANPTSQIRNVVNSAPVGCAHGVRLSRRARSHRCARPARRRRQHRLAEGRRVAAGRRTGHRGGAHGAGRPGGRGCRRARARLRGGRSRRPPTGDDGHRRSGGQRPGGH